MKDRKFKRTTGRIDIVLNLKSILPWNKLVHLCLLICRSPQIITIAKPPDLRHRSEFGTFDMAHLVFWDRVITKEQVRIAAELVYIRNAAERRKCEEKKGNYRFYCEVGTIHCSLAWRKRAEESRLGPTKI